MKAVMISIQPKWCELIASGRKTIEVRKTRPKINTPFKCYIYCTKGKENEKTCFGKYTCHIGNGKVIGEFVCDMIEEYTFFTYLTKFSNMGLPFGTLSSYLIFEDDYKKMCLSYDEVKKYGNRQTLYAWHISDLVIYDEPKDWSEFKFACSDKVSSCRACKHSDETGMHCTTITRPPQSWQYVEELEEN